MSSNALSPVPWFQMIQVDKDIADMDVRSLTESTLHGPRLESVKVYKGGMSHFIQSVHD